MTGGAGFIGCAISAGLLAHYDRVVVVDSLHPQIHKHRARPAGLAPAVELRIADVTKPATWDAVLDDLRPTTIVHLAAETGTGQSLTEAARHTYTNVYGTGVMLDALARHKAIPECITLASSRAIYGEGAWISAAGNQLVYPRQRTPEQLARGEWEPPGWAPLPSTSGETRPSPVSIYGSTKLAQEQIISIWAEAFMSRVVILRLQNVYGPGQSLTNSYTGIVSLFCRMAREGGQIPLYEDGKMLRDFVFIDDVAEALIAATQRVQDRHCILDIGTGRATTIGDIADQIAAKYRAPPPYVCGKYRHGDVRHAVCATEAAREVLGWSARHELSVGLVKLLDWIEGQFAMESG